jgi:hypothetical protein
MSGPDTRGEGREEHDGFVVLEGATGRVDDTPSFHASLKALRAGLIEEEVLVPHDGVYRLSQDYKLTSPSAAAAILLGRNANGRVEWKTSSGESLKEIQDRSVS